MNRILVIDDDESTRESLTSYLSELGYEVYEADNGLKGLEIIKNNFPDLIISDIRMSGLNGIELAYVVKGLNYNIPIILVSCYENADLKFEDSFCFAYLQKPLDISDLRRNIGMALKRAA
ncbi:MAG: response regulator [Ignavibacteriae bacterium]|nr:response regulator [Ignavibacteriota bacterium]